MGRPHAGTYLICFEAHCSRSMGAQRALQRPPSAHNTLGALLRSLHIYIVIIIRLSAAFMGAAALPAAASAVRREGSWPCGTVLGFEIDPCGDARTWWYGCTNGTTLASHSTLSDGSNKESPQNRADVCGF